MRIYYSVHDLVTFFIEGEKKKIEYLDKQCGYFRVEYPIEKVDIEIRLGPFKSIADADKEYCFVNRKYCVGNDVIYAEDSYKVARWKIQIENLDKEDTKIYFDGNHWTKYILHKSFVEVLLRYKLNQKGFVMVHSSAVGISGKAFVFPASPEAGKTSTMLNYLEAGNAFMADDFSLVGDGNAYAYPTPITLHSHNLKRHPFLKDVLSRKDKIQIFFRTMVLKITLGKGDISYKVDIWNRLKNASVVDCIPLEKIILLTKHSGEKVVSRKIARAEMAEILAIVNYYETVQFNGYLNAYYYVNRPNRKDEFWERMRENIYNILVDDYYDEILLPSRYSAKEFQDVVNIIRKFVGGGYKRHLIKQEWFKDMQQYPGRRLLQYA